MNKYRALGTLSTLFKVIAWIVLVAGIVATIAVGALGALQATRGVSELLTDVPFVNQIAGWVPALLGAAGVLIAALLLFVWVMALSEAIRVALAIEQNTRETALYLRGESQLPAPPAPAAWDAEETRA